MKMKKSAQSLESGADNEALAMSRHEHCSSSQNKFVTVNSSLTVYSEDFEQSVTLKPKQLEGLIVWLIATELLVFQDDDGTTKNTKWHKHPDEINIYPVAGSLLTLLKGGSAKS